ncbi:MAG: hypothetical protein HY360_05265 [Verrucomicrobia bacterium]|nr:hypothetical protein [Verrucomicrobiota bacterium]
MIIMGRLARTFVPASWTTMCEVAAHSPHISHSRVKYAPKAAHPLEQEVALDPELLGHVFENLLAAFNPETGTVASKVTVSFYTPRVGLYLKFGCLVFNSSLSLAT